MLLWDSITLKVTRVFKIISSIERFSLDFVCFSVVATITSTSQPQQQQQQQWRWWWWNDDDLGKRISFQWVIYYKSN